MRKRRGWRSGEDEKVVAVVEGGRGIKERAEVRRRMVRPERMQAMIQKARLSCRRLRLDMVLLSCCFLSLSFLRGLEEGLGMKG